MDRWAQVRWQIYLLYDSVGLFIGMILGWVFYHRWWMGLLIIPGISFYHRLVERLWRERKKQQFRLEFRDALQQMQGYMQAGRSLENAMYQTGGYLEQNQPEGLLVSEWKRMTGQLQRNGTAETAWIEFAEKNPLEEVRQFAGILSVARRRGGSMTEVIQTAVHEISLLIQTEEEVRGVVGAQKLQMQVLEIVPVALLCYINLSAPEMLEGMYQSVIGLMIMTGCLAVYLCAVWIGNRLTDIQA